MFLPDNGLREAGWSHKAPFIVERESKKRFFHTFITPQSMKIHGLLFLFTVKGSPTSQVKARTNLSRSL